MDDDRNRGLTRQEVKRLKDAGVDVMGSLAVDMEVGDLEKALEPVDAILTTVGYVDAELDEMTPGACLGLCKMVMERTFEAREAEAKN